MAKKQTERVNVMNWIKKIETSLKKKKPSLQFEFFKVFFYLCIFWFVLSLFI